MSRKRNPLPYRTTEKSVNKVSKTKGNAVTDEGEWTMEFTAHMSVVVNRCSSRAAELLEFMSLIRFAARMQPPCNKSLKKVGNWQIVAAKNLHCSSFTSLICNRCILKKTTPVPVIILTQWFPVSVAPAG